MKPDLSILQLVLNASWVVQLVMLLLWRFYTTILLTVLGFYLLVLTHGVAAAKELFTVGWFRRR